eukprot:2235184-Alexandrium_andersonii.AAC.1
MLASTGATPLPVPPVPARAQPRRHAETPRRFRSPTKPTDLACVPLRAGQASWMQWGDPWARGLHF